MAYAGKLERSRFWCGAFRGGSKFGEFFSLGWGFFEGIEIEGKVEERGGIHSEMVFAGKFEDEV